MQHGRLRLRHALLVINYWRFSNATGLSVGRGRRKWGNVGNSHRQAPVYPSLTFRFCCRHPREDIDGAPWDRDDAAASRKDSAEVAGWPQPRWTFRSRSRSSHESIVARGSRKGDSVWVVALLGRARPSFSLPRWPFRTEDRWAAARCTKLSRRRLSSPLPSLVRRPWYPGEFRSSNYRGNFIHRE